MKEGKLRQRIAKWSAMLAAIAFLMRAMSDVLRAIEQLYPDRRIEEQ